MEARIGAISRLLTDQATGVNQVQLSVNAACRTIGRTAQQVQSAAAEAAQLTPCASELRDTAGELARIAGT